MNTLKNNKLLFINNKKLWFKRKGKDLKIEEDVRISEITKDDILTLSLIIYKVVLSRGGHQKQLSDYIEKITANDTEDPYSFVIYESVYEILENIFNNAREIEEEINDKKLNIKSNLSY